MREDDGEYFSPNESSWLIIIKMRRIDELDLVFFIN